MTWPYGCAVLLGERVCHNTIDCIVIGEQSWACSVAVSRYNKLYRDIAVLECRFARGGFCRNTPNCIVTEMKAGYWGTMSRYSHCIVTSG